MDGLIGAHSWRRLPSSHCPSHCLSVPQSRWGNALLRHLSNNRRPIWRLSTRSRCCACHACVLWSRVSSSLSLDKSVISACPVYLLEEPARGVEWAFKPKKQGKAMVGQCAERGQVWTALAGCVTRRLHEASRGVRIERSRAGFGRVAGMPVCQSPFGAGGHALGISCRANFLERAYTGRRVSREASVLLVASCLSNPSRC
ncbi:hypothetical protein BDP55DRAFT_23775 [Colletotrichum godetiae]|uniref:Uncharacterized protein n=1 Tax=Colletotrichum godetiae TaxID=1209918 RepID=A0AAJ0B083_9PEZI|nr:uncharacterized protein BDP55DRAFT_23775 [Colletotrichum godetiae]KAK1701554.1 hypothetical protein BDP55DRAFT_23775 [Colletotrichum godetiae]